MHHDYNSHGPLVCHHSDGQRMKIVDCLPAGSRLDRREPRIAHEHHGSFKDARKMDLFVPNSLSVLQSREPTVRPITMASGGFGKIFRCSVPLRGLDRFIIYKRLRPFFVGGLIGNDQRGDKCKKFENALLKIHPTVYYVRNSFARGIYTIIGGCGKMRVEKEFFFGINWILRILHGNDS